MMGHQDANKGKTKAKNSLVPNKTEDDCSLKVQERKKATLNIKIDKITYNNLYYFAVMFLLSISVICNLNQYRYHDEYHCIPPQKKKEH